MPRIPYESNTMRGSTLTIAEQAAEILREYAANNYDVTLRQLYYRFVSSGLTADWPTGHNTTRSYKRLGSIVDKARMCGIIDWDHLIDRERPLYGTSHYDSPADLISLQQYYFHRDKWVGQPNRVELWVEKVALIGVIGRVGGRRDVDHFACKGYASQSAMWKAARRLERYLENGQDVTILHLGDHDPSGIDMTRDITERLQGFIEYDLGWSAADWLTVHRIALNMDQVNLYQPPENPAKMTDSRATNKDGTGYVDRFGSSSWELDALPPDVLTDLINGHIDDLIDQDLFDQIAAEERAGRRQLEQVSRRWPEVAALVGNG